jgi:O-antigen/teichoic acid export membrane protein
VSIVATQSMRGHVAAGVRWSAVNQLIQQSTRFAVQIVLTRLLAPQAFGLLALAFVVVNFGSLLTNIGFSQALIQRRTLEPGLVDAVFVGSGIFGLALAGAIAAAAYPLAWALGDVHLEHVLQALSVVFVFQGVEGVPNSLLRRQMMFRLYNQSSTIAVLAGGTVGIVAGVLGADVWALVGFAVTEAVVATTLAWVYAVNARVWMPRLTRDLRPLKSVLGYSTAITGNRMLFYGSRNADNLIVGRVLGTVALGYYGLAYRLMLYPIQRSADVIGTVALSAFARMQDDARRLEAAYLRAVRYLAVVVVPITVLVAVSAPHLVPVVFGGRWEAAAAPLRILAMSGPALAVVRLNGAVWEATGRAAISFWISAVSLGVLVPGFLIGVHYGVDGVAWAYSITLYAGLAPTLWVLARTTGIRVRKQVVNVLPVLVAGALAAGVAVGVDAALPASAGHLAHLLLMTVSGLGAYTGCVLTTDRQTLTEGMRLLWARSP